MHIPSANDYLEKLKNSNKVDSFDTAIENANFWDRHLIIGDIDSDVGDAIEGMIRFWNKVDDENGIPVSKRRPIKLYIDSYGGDMGATFTMVDAIKISKTPVYGINIGAAYSGGFFTLVSCHKRFAYPHSTFLFHEGSTMNGGTSSQFENYSQFYKKQLQQLRSITIENTKITPEEYDSIKKDDVWYSADEALEKGIIDEIAENFI